MRRRKLRVGLLTVGTVLAVQALALIPTASADTCVVTVTTVTGQHLTFTVNVAPGTPVSALNLPVAAPIANVSESCSAPPPPPPPTTTTTTTSSSATSTSSSSSSSSSTSTTSSHSSSSSSSSGSHSTTGNKGGSGGNGGGTKGSGGNKGGAGNQGGGTNKGGGSKPSGSSGGSQGKGGSKGKTNKNPGPLKPTGAGGVPTAANPTFSFALPGAAPIGVPNFFIDSFRIPPFLLPIYQAAGIQYDVPWQVLAGINEIETDYGRNLSTSSAGAVGWMQFLPETWKSWGVDANGDGIADPYNPVDAIFSAARYLHAAGASRSINAAIFAYNHASWYVQSVLLRAKLIGGMPDQLIGALSGLVEGHFPVAAPAKYADSSVTTLARKPVRSSNAAIPVGSDPRSKDVRIFAKENSPVIAVNDGKIVRVGQSAAWGRFVQLQDETGNIFTYAHLGSVPSQYPVPKPVKITAAQLTKELSAPVLPSPTAPASAGQQQGASVPSTAQATSQARQEKKITLPVTNGPATQKQTTSAATQTPLVKERLFADPARPASYAAGGALQLRTSSAKISSFQNYFSDVLHLGKNQYTLKPLKAGAVVVAGTILGRVARGDQKTASHMTFMIQPAGKNAPQIDPKPILDGWKLLEATAVYRAAGVNPFFGPGAKDPTIGQILLMSKEQLQNRILQDPHVQIYSCGRRDIEAGLIDRRVLATLEFLSASGLSPSVSGLICGQGVLTSTNPADSAGATGSSVDIAKINNIQIKGHEGKGSITDITIRRLLTLQGAMKPDQIISTMSYKGQANTLALPDHSDRIQVSFTPLFGSNKKLSTEIKSILQPGQWTKLINRISQIPEPVVPIAPSKYAIRTVNPGAH